MRGPCSASLPRNGGNPGAAGLWKRRPAALGRLRDARACGFGGIGRATVAPPAKRRDAASTHCGRARRPRAEGRAPAALRLRLQPRLRLHLPQPRGDVRLRHIHGFQQPGVLPQELLPSRMRMPGAGLEQDDLHHPPPVPEGALRRIFDFVQVIKRSPGYTETIGQDLDILGVRTRAARPVPPSPRRRSRGRAASV